MNFDNYRRAMDANKLSDKKKASLAAFAEATPLRGSPKFEKLKRRKRAKIISYASLAACFTVVCLAGAPLLFFGIFWRAGSAAPEASITTQEGSHTKPTYGLFDQHADADLFATEAITAATGAAQPNSGVGGYEQIYLLMNSGVTDEHASVSPERTEAPSETTHFYTSPELSPGIVTESFSAAASGSTVTITCSNGAEQTLVYGGNTKVIALFAYDNVIVVCADVERETVAFAYAVTDSEAPRLLGDLGISGNLMDACVEGNVLTVITEFTPSAGEITDYAAYIPQLTQNGKTELISAEDCIVTEANAGKYTCFVVIDVELSDSPEILSVRAEFTASTSAGANKK